MDDETKKAPMTALRLFELLDDLIKKGVDTAGVEVKINGYDVNNVVLNTDLETANTVLHLTY